MANYGIEVNAGRFDTQLQCDYFQWLSDTACRNDCSDFGTWDTLLQILHSIDFVFMMEMDRNRASDGLALRSRFGRERKIPDYLIEQELYFPCSVLEMMVALADRCESQIMDRMDGEVRTGKWFLAMIESLGLSSMRDPNCDEYFVLQIVRRFLLRQYSPDGTGGLFTVPRCRQDMRQIDIWYQMMAYLNHLEY